MNRNRFYKNKREGKWMGVCAGLADYTGIEAVWWRIGAVMLTFFALGPLAPILYIIIGMIADERPLDTYRETPAQEKFVRQTRAAPQRSIRDVHARFRALDRRLGDIERGVTTQNTSLAREIDAL
ncbi:MAG: envelope stress response membrane protein PspC [Pacificimonas sp.]